LAYNCGMAWRVMRSRGSCLLVVCAVLGCGRGGADGGRERAPGAADDAAAHPGVPGKREELLRSDRIYRMHLQLDPAAMAALADQPRKYVAGALHFGEHRLERVAVRFKGHRTLRDWSGKPSFKIHVSRLVKGRRFMGLKQLILDNNVEDPTMLRSTLGNFAARELGVAAPRTGFVELRVNDELFGLYTLVEPPDKPFLGRHFEDATGPLYEGEYGCDLYAGDVVSMELDGGEDPDRRLIAALATAAAGPLDALFDADSGLIDAEDFLRFLSVSAVIGDFDGYRHAHNYRLYRDRGRGRWSFLPWGLDRVLKKEVDPFDHNSLLARKCIADRGCQLAYVKALHETSLRFEALGLEAKLDALERVVRKAAARDPRRPHDLGKRKRELEKTRRFIRDAPAALRARLGCWDGERELDRDGDGHGCQDCDDQNAAVHPGAREVCNGLDDDCSGLVDDAPACACERAEAEGQGFALCDLPMSWEQAARFCKARGEHLARIATREQSKALAKEAMKVDDTLWWIGLSDRAREGAMVWHDASEQSFTNWSNGEPDHHACGQDCGVLKKGGRWRDMHCGRRRPFICSDSGQSP